MTSTNDKLLPDRPNGAGIRSEIEAAGGVIGYWQDQPLLLPQTALALGESDGYVHVRAAAVPIVPDNSLTRHVYFQVNDRGMPRWIALEAFDTQNVCVEGRRED
jgi:hypothetical protein